MAIPAFSPTAGYARVSTLNYPTVTIVTNATAAAVTFSASDILSGFIMRDTGSAARADLLPKAADVIAAINGCQVGTSFRFFIRNTSAGAGSITVTTNTGNTLSGTVAIVFQQQKEFMAVVTNVTRGSEAITYLSLGASVAI
jgi:hypothetical protein